MKKIILFLIIFLSFIFFPANPAFAITKTTANMTVTYDDPMFDSSVVWYPGLSVNREIEVTNTSNTNRRFLFQGENLTDVGNLFENLEIAVSQNGIDLYGGTSATGKKTVAQMVADNEIYLSDVGAQSVNKYIFNVKMPGSLGNDFQNTKTVFDIKVGFEGQSGTTLGTSTQSNGSSNPPVCLDTAPGSAPVLISAVAGFNSVILSWTPAENPVSYYLIAFGNSSGSYAYGNPNVGPQGTTSYTINGISGGQTLYFVVRAGNGCAPGPFSNEISVIPLGEEIEAAPAGFFPGVLGEATETAKLTQKPKSKSSIKGASTSQCSCYALPILLGELIVLGLYLKLQKNRNLKTFSVSILIPLLALYFYNRFQICPSGEFLCSYFSISLLAFFSLYSLFFWKKPGGR